jgi:hypothetical protein
MAGIVMFYGLCIGLSFGLDLLALDGLDINDFFV